MIIWYVVLMVVMRMKTSVILVENFFGYLITLIGMLVQLQSSHFVHKIHSNALPLGDIVLGGNKNL